MLVMLFGTLKNNEIKENIPFEIEIPRNEEIDSDFSNKKIND